VALAALLASCSSTRLVKQYEYEEEVYLDADGSATVYVNASLYALRALRGLEVDAGSARVDRAAIRSLFESPVTDVTRVSRPWRRQGRRFVQVRVEVSDIRRLGEARPFAWSAYSLARDGEARFYRQRLGEPAGGDASAAGWKGDELVAVRLHLPSRITYHNATSKKVDRGNILAFEQTLADRLRGVPLEIEVRMEGESILYRTLLVFGAAVAAALALLAAAIWWVIRKGRREAAP
jgi:hypothetical protein